MPFKDFDAAVRESTAEPIEFQLMGTTFRCREPFPVGSIIIFARAAKEKGIEQIVGLDNMLLSWIDEAQHDEWTVVLSKLPDLGVLNEIVEYIIEEITGRPSAAPSS